MKAPSTINLLWIMGCGVMIVLVGASYNITPPVPTILVAIVILIIFKSWLDCGADHEQEELS